MYLFDKVWIITFSIMYGPHNDSNDHVTKTGTTLNINWYQALKLGLAVSNRIFIYTYSLNMHISTLQSQWMVSFMLLNALIMD